MAKDQVIRFVINFSPEDHAHLKELANRLPGSMQNAMRRLIRQEVARQEAGGRREW